MHASMPTYIQYIQNNTCILHTYMHTYTILMGSIVGYRWHAR